MIEFPSFMYNLDRYIFKCIVNLTMYLGTLYNLRVHSLSVLCQSFSLQGTRKKNWLMAMSAVGVKPGSRIGKIIYVFANVLPFNFQVSRSQL